MVNKKDVFKKLNMSKGSIMTKAAFVVVDDNMIKIENNCSDDSKECKSDSSQILSVKFKSVEAVRMSPSKVD